jgi:PHAX RNA-binding domain
MAIDDSVSYIAKTLGEFEETPLSQIGAVVRVLGEQAALALLKEAIEIEKSGGMLVPDGTRRRSPGGVFFQLARGKLPHDEKKAIFFREGKAPPSQPPPSSAPVTTGGAPPSSRRKRVVEVAPSRPSSRPPPEAFTPPELSSALVRARIRQRILELLGPLPIAERYGLLLDLLADLHDRLPDRGRPPPSEDGSPSRSPARGG